MLSLAGELAEELEMTTSEDAGHLYDTLGTEERLGEETSVVLHVCDRASGEERSDNRT